MKKWDEVALSTAVLYQWLLSLSLPATLFQALQVGRWIWSFLLLFYNILLPHQVRSSEASSALCFPGKIEAEDTSGPRCLPPSSAPPVEETKSNVVTSVSKVLLHTYFLGIVSTENNWIIAIYIVNIEKAWKLTILMHWNGRCPAMRQCTSTSFFTTYHCTCLFASLVCPHPPYLHQTAQYHKWNEAKCTKRRHDSDSAAIPSLLYNKQACCRMASLGLILAWEDGCTLCCPMTDARDAEARSCKWLFLIFTLSSNSLHC